MLSRSRRVSWEADSQKGLTLATRSWGSTWGFMESRCRGGGYCQLYCSPIDQHKATAAAVLGDHLRHHEVRHEFSSLHLAAGVHVKLGLVNTSTQHSPNTCSAFLTVIWGFVGSFCSSFFGLPPLELLLLLP